MKTLGYYNGNYGPLEEMTVPMNDRACYFGDGVYEATLAKNGKIFALKEHLDRFFNSAGLLKIEIPYTREELTSILYDMLAKMDDSEIFIYWQVTRGTGIRQHQFPAAGTKGEPVDLHETWKARRFQQASETDRYGGHPLPSLQHQDTEPAPQRYGC